MELLQKNDVAEVGIIVIHNKLKEKRGKISDNVKYFAGEDIPDAWVVYPWDAIDIEEHDRLSK